MIFEMKARTRTEPKQPSEDEFAFYDSAGDETVRDYNRDELVEMRAGP